MIRDFSMDEIVYSGQVFRWDKVDDTYIGVVKDKVYRIKEGSEDEILLDPLLTEYFDLNSDYGNIKDELSKDPILGEAIKSCPGMRILNQDLWETIISFIISQNNNIPRIKGLIEKISMKYGRLIEDNYYTFPEPKILANLKVSDLEELKFGYRAGYIVETAKRYVELGYDRMDNPKLKFLEDSRKMGLSSETYLMTFKGIGPKVANCISLFALHEIDSFPIDVWVKRVMNTLYDIPLDKVNLMREYAKNNFSPYAGIAQQYLFYYIRNFT